MRRPFLSAFVLIAVLHASVNAYGAELEIIFLDVGQGDAVLLREGEHVALVDAGPTDNIVKKLKHLGVKKLDLFVASHNHDDHIGGADAVLEHFDVGTYLDNGFPAATFIQNRVLELMRKKHVRLATPTIATFAFGDAILRFLPLPRFPGGDEQNNRSIGLLVEHGHFKALFTGDSEVEEIAAWLTLGLIPDVDVLKAAHHGSRNGVSPLLLHQSKPEVVVISVGKENVYGHPHSMALRYYETDGRRVFRTDRDGDVVVRVDEGGAYDVRSARSSTDSSSSRTR